MEIRNMKIEDYDDAWKLWIHTKGVALNNLDDSREGIRRFLKRNPSTCFVAVEERKLMGVILAGQDGRRGYIYHLATAESARRNKIGTNLLRAAEDALKAEGITKAALLVNIDNESGNGFWENAGFKGREDLLYRSKELVDTYKIDTE